MENLPQRDPVGSDVAADTSLQIVNGIGGHLLIVNPLWSHPMSSGSGTVAGVVVLDVSRMAETADLDLEAFTQPESAAKS